MVLENTLLSVSLTVQAAFLDCNSRPYLDSTENSQRFQEKQYGHRSSYILQEATNQLIWAIFRFVEHWHHQERRILPVLRDMQIKEQDVLTMRRGTTIVLQSLFQEKSTWQLGMSHVGTMLGQTKEMIGTILLVY